MKVFILLFSFFAVGIGVETILEGDRIELTDDASGTRVNIITGTIPSDYDLTLPTANGTANQCIADTDGSGTLGFISVVKPGDTAGGALQGTYLNPEIATHTAPVSGTLNVVSILPPTQSPVGLFTPDNGAGATQNAYIETGDSTVSTAGHIYASSGTGPTDDDHGNFIITSKWVQLATTHSNNFVIIETTRNDTGGAGNTQDLVIESGRIDGTGSSGTTGDFFARSGDIRGEATGTPGIAGFRGGDNRNDANNGITTPNITFRSGRNDSDTSGGSGNATFSSGDVNTDPASVNNNASPSGNAILKSGNADPVVGVSGDTYINVGSGGGGTGNVIINQNNNATSVQVQAGSGNLVEIKSGDLILDDSWGVILQDVTNSNELTLVAPNPLPASYPFTYPPDIGSSGECLKTNGSVTDWGSCSTLSIGSPVSGGAIDGVLFVDGAGNLDNTSNFTYNEAAGTLSFIDNVNSTEIEFNGTLNDIRLQKDNNGDFYIFDITDGRSALYYDESDTRVTTDNRFRVNTISNDLVNGSIRIDSDGQNPSLALWNTNGAPNVASRNWQIATNWTDWAALEFRVSSTASGNPDATSIFELYPARIDMNVVDVNIEGGTRSYINMNGTADDYSIRNDSNGDFIVRSDTATTDIIEYDTATNDLILRAEDDIVFQPQGGSNNTLEVIGDTVYTARFGQGIDDASHNGVVIENAVASAATTTYLLQLDYTVDTDVSNTPGPAKYLQMFDGDGAPGEIIAAGADSVSYITTSDARLKTEVGPIDDAVERVMQLEPKKYTWNSDNRADEGFFAQEAEQIVPGAVTGSPDSDPILNPMGMDYGKLTPVLWAALRAVIQKNHDLENRIRVLESLAPNPTPSEWVDVSHTPPTYGAASDLVACASFKECRSLMIENQCPGGQKVFIKKVSGSIVGLECKAPQ